MLLPFSSEVCETAEWLNSCHRFAVEQLHYSEQSFWFSISITVTPSLFGRVPWLDASWDSTTLIFFPYEWFLKYQFIVWTNYMICLLKLKVSASKCMCMYSSCRLKSHLNSCWISYNFAESWEFIKKGCALLERRWVNERHISFWLFDEQIFADPTDELDLKMHNDPVTWSSDWNDHQDVHQCQYRPALNWWTRWKFHHNHTAV